MLHPSIQLRASYETPKTASDCLRFLIQHAIPALRIRTDDTESKPHTTEEIMGLFESKVVMVTGGAMGIGRDTALAFGQEGASVVIADVNREAANTAAMAIKRAGGIARAIAADVSRSEHCRRVVSETVDFFGGVDILFNNVGIQPISSYTDVVGTSEEIWDHIIAVNLGSVFLMAKYAIPHMRRRGGGVIINNASVQGLQSMRKVPAYAASKGAILSLTRAMALDHAADNIRVVAICPGTIDTAMVRAAAAALGSDIEGTLATWGAMHPLGRIGNGKDVADAVLFLASDRASFITGSFLCVDGGFMAQGAWGRGPGASAST